MYPNLRAEIVRNGYSVSKTAILVGMSTPTMYAKLSGERDFFYKEVSKIRELLCPDKSLEYLMETRDDTTQGG